MKKNVFIFVAAALLILATIPVINIIKQANNHQEIHWKTSVFYNFDFALSFLNKGFYQLGISTDPNQVIIGKQDWLYLGDEYRQTLTVTRYGATEHYMDMVKKIGAATNAWDQWLKSKGVQQFHIMIAANKSTIYSEFLPDWMQPATHSVTDMLLANVSQELYIDTRSALKNAKSQFFEPLYYKTDTHWNNLGASVAFLAFTTRLAHTNTSLRWLSTQQIQLSKVEKCPGGDLLTFLRMNNILQDSEVTVDIVTGTAIETELYNFETGDLIISGGNPQISVPPEKPPILVKSKHALNNKKALWLHDSFGIALAPFMAATFSETLQLHYIKTSATQLAKLIETYRPEYVFITVTERDIIDTWFQNLPPS